MADFNIRVVVDTSQVQTGTAIIERNFDRINQRADRLRNTISRALSFLGISIGINQLIQLADSFTIIQNRINQVTNSTIQLSAVTNELFRVSQQTRNSFQATAEVYTRVSLSTRELGLTQQETIKFTEQLNKAVILSGATAAEAHGGLIQLAQGLASGTLQGDELRSVLEQLPAVADVIANQLGVTRGEIRQFGREGRITADVVIEAFKTMSDEIDAQFAKTVPTISQAFQVLTNATIKAVGEFGIATGITEAFARGLIFLANNMDTIIRLLEVLTIVVGVRLVRAGFAVATRAVIAFTAALAANPIGFILTAITATVAALTVFSDQIKVSSDGMATLADVGSVVFDDLSKGLSEFTSYFEDEFQFVNQALGGLFDDFDFSLKGIVSLVARAADRQIGIWIGVFNSIKAIFSRLPDALAEVFINAFNGVISIVEKSINFLIGSVNEVARFAGLEELAVVDIERVQNTLEGSGRALGTAIKDAFVDGLEFNVISEAVTGVFDRAEQVAQERATRERDRQRQERESLQETRGGGRPDVRAQVQKILDDLARETELLKLNNREREVQQSLIKIEEELKLKLSGTERSLLDAALRLNQELKIQSDVLNSIRGPQEELSERQRALISLYDEGTISLKEFNNEMLNLRLQQAELNIQAGEGSFADGFLLGIEQMLESVRNFASEAGSEFANFFQSTSEGFSQAIADSIVFGTSFKEAIGNVARRALADLLGGLIKIGLQYILNASLGEAAAVAATTSSITQAQAVAAAWATPAALTSLASFGTNAAPATASIASTVAFSNALAAAGAAGFADGGYVSGPGSARSDSVPALLSNGEFVMNAKSTARFRPVLEQMNNPRGFQVGGMVGENGTSSAPVNTTQNQNESSIRILNVLDPSVVEDFLTSSAGERVIVNSIERNASSVQQILQNN